MKERERKTWIERERERERERKRECKKKFEVLRLGRRHPAMTQAEDTGGVSEDGWANTHTHTHHKLAVCTNLLD